jgi:propanol-preferring alcohol dehydrogenase
MKAMVLTRICDLRSTQAPLEQVDLAVPVPGPGQVLIRVAACGVCHTELDEIEGRTPPAALPVVPGHQVVGRVERLGPQTTGLKVGDRVGVAWIYHACGHCRFCTTARENLCPDFKAAGRDANGGYAEYMIASAEFVSAIPEGIPDMEAAPLLCAGAVGYRSLRLTGLQNGQSLGLTGFGASGHLVLQMARFLYPDTQIYAFARSAQERQFALQLGAAWAGDPADPCPTALDAVIDTTPAWTPVIEALKALSPGGRLVINAIRKEEVDKVALLGLDYAKALWMERQIQTVANVTRQDVREMLTLAGRMQLRPEVQEYRLEDANRALLDLKNRRIRGAKVLRIAD